MGAPLGKSQHHVVNRWNVEVGYTRRQSPYPAMSLIS